MDDYAIFEPLAKMVANKKSKRLAIPRRVGCFREYEAVLSRAKDISRAISPTIYKKLTDLEKENRIKVNKNCNTDLEEMEIDFIIGEENPDTERIAELQKIIAKKQNTPADTHYSWLTDTLYLRADSTDDDILAIIHEVAHGATPGSGKVLTEVVPIIAEFVADRYVGADITERRINDMKMSANFVCDFFDEPTAANRMEARYFFGPAAALTLEPHIETSEDLEKIIHIANDTKHTDTEKLKKMGVTGDKMISAYYMSAVSSVLAKQFSPVSQETHTEKIPT
ncbi:MAG: hypothetical protein LBQ05_03125 [Christensenellaceae bacterium]|jgi:hypothetical protein|nr:hypothetical protein [Christensenellaceae bacterium]